MTMPPTALAAAAMIPATGPNSMIAAKTNMKPMLTVPSIHESRIVRDPSRNAAMAKPMVRNQSGAPEVHATRTVAARAATEIPAM
ncbi:MAG TPA: hypothetical protein QGH10_08410 [Armatimonadota bacterium]|nr:hypothetical protein [Armatimonadota bacterium]